VARGPLTEALAGRVADAIGREALTAGRYDAGLVAGTELLAGASGRALGFPAALIVVALFLALGGGKWRRGGSGLLSALLWGSLLGSGVGLGLPLAPETHEARAFRPGLAFIAAPPAASRR